MAKRPDGSGEDALIARYFRPLAGEAGAFALADDAAIIEPPADADVVVTTDGVICGVHFFPDDPADSVAKKALRMNLSDLAAKGATPLGFVLAIALPRDFDEAWVAAFAKGLGEDIAVYGCPLLGGDTDHTPGLLSVSITAFGIVPKGKMVRRSGAKPGDIIVVTGTIGDSSLGLLLRREPARFDLAAEHREHLLERYLLPQPRTGLADAVRRHASAAMDVSDGLAGDLAKLCRASKVSADVDSAHVPLSPAARAALAGDPRLIETILAGGDDYEILATVAPDNVAALKQASAGISVTEIGRVSDGGASCEARFIDTAGLRIAFARPGYSHF
jgi:thiamine-monophosphate kinase